jgi:hypothetical protein
MKEPGQPGGRDGQGHGDRLAEQGRHGGDSRDIHHHALAKLQCLEIGAIATQRDFLIRAAIRVVEDGTWDAAPRKQSQIFNTGDDRHEVSSSILQQYGFLSRIVI